MISAQKVPIIWMKNKLLMMKGWKVERAQSYSRIHTTGLVTTTSNSQEYFIHDVFTRPFLQKGWYFILRLFRQDHTLKYGPYSAREVTKFRNIWWGNIFWNFVTLGNLTYMKRILQLVPVKLIIFKPSYNWFTYWHSSAAPAADCQLLVYSAIFMVTSTTLCI